MTDTSEATLDIDHLRGWIGREIAAEDIVSADLVRKYRATMDTADTEPAQGEEAPPLLHFCLAQPAVLTSELGDDGHPARGGFLPPVPLPRRMWAGGNVETLAPLRVGDEVRRFSRIRDVAAKTGRTGQLCFVTVEHTIVRENQTAILERQDIVYRAAQSSGAGAEPPAAEVGDHRREITPSPALLFRYSALTFNGHRIHYDRKYVTEVEGYLGLIVHGPMQAAQLAGFAAELKGSAPRRFSFRSQSPIFDIDRYSLNAAESETGLRLWTAKEGGPVSMMAEAQW